MKNILLRLKFIVAILLIASVGYAKTVYLTDLEGRIEPFLELFNNGTLVLDQDGEFAFADPDTHLVFGGDLMDRGPHSIKLMRYFTYLKTKYPNRVTLIWGNRDLNKLSFFATREERLSNLQDPKYREFLNKKLLELPKGQQRYSSIDRVNTAANQVRWWADQFGLGNVIELHRQEMQELAGATVSLHQAEIDYADLLTNPYREYLKFIKLGQLVHSEGDVVMVHGGLPAVNGFVPDSSNIHENYNEWQSELNSWGRRQISDFIRGVSDGRLNGRSKKLIFYSDALYDSKLHQVWNHDNSVIYGPRYKENGNFRLPPETTLQWLRANGKKIVILGHSAAGNVPTPLRGEGLIYLMADTSQSPNGLFANIAIDKGTIEISGVLENGTRAHYRISADDVNSPVGLLLGEETVVGTTVGGQAVLFKYIGFERHERTLPMIDVLSGDLKIPTFQINEEFEKQKVNLLPALSERGEKILELDTFGSEFLNGRVPILFSGSSAYADDSQEAIVRDMVASALSALDPSKVVIVTGATEKGPEKIVHEIAARMGFYIHGLVVSAAVPDEVSTKLNSVSWVGHDWESQPKAGMEFIRHNSGLGIIIGGGGLVHKGLEYGQSIGAEFVVASNVKHGNGSVSASMKFADLLSQSSFSNGLELGALIRRYKFSRAYSNRKNQTSGTCNGLLAN